MSIYKEHFAESLKWGIGYCVVALLIGAFICLSITFYPFLLAIHSMLRKLFRNYN